MLSQLALLPLVIMPLRSLASLNPNSPTPSLWTTSSTPTSFPSPGPWTNSTSTPAEDPIGYHAADSFFSAMLDLLEYCPPLPVVIVLLVLAACTPTWARRVVLPMMREGLSEAISCLTIWMFYVSSVLLCLMGGYYYGPVLSLAYFVPQSPFPSTMSWSLSPTLVGPASGLLTFLLLCGLVYSPIPSMCSRFLDYLRQRALRRHTVAYC